MPSTEKNYAASSLDVSRELLEELCKSYDAMETDVFALPISTSIRVLVHDTESSTSLLGKLGKKDIPFISTNGISSDGPVHLGLVRRINVGVRDGKGGEARYWPNCDERYFCDESPKTLLDFEKWWDSEQVFISASHSLTRKDLVLSVANKDGGAHFDEKVKKKYSEFRHSWSGGTSLVGIHSGHSRGYDNIPTRPAIRQVAQELMMTINAQLS